MTTPAAAAPAATYAVKQRFTLGVNRYDFTHADAEGNPTDQRIAFAQQKMFKLKEEVIFWADDAKTTRAFSFKARNVLDLKSVVDVFDEHGREIGGFRKDFGASLMRSTWYVKSGASEELKGQERSELVAVLRRFADISFVPYHFDFAAPDGRVGFSVEKKWGLRDKYTVKVYDNTLDWRVVAAMSVALDTLQGR